MIIDQEEFNKHLINVEVVHGHYALLSTLGSLHLVDLDDVTPSGDVIPSLGNIYDFQTYGTLAHDNGYVYCNMFAAKGLGIVRLDTDPMGLTLVDTIAEPGVFFGRVAAAGNRLYVPAFSFGIRVFDITDGAAPVLISSLQEGFTSATAIEISGNTLYVADGAGGLKIVDISDELSPEILDGEDLDSAEATAGDVMVIGENVYVAAGGAGVAFYPSGNIAQRQIFDTPIMAKQLAKVGDYLAVADRNGLVVFGIESDGSLVERGQEYCRYRQRTPGFISERLWLGLDAWGDDRVIAANWDTTDIYQFDTPDAGIQPDIFLTQQRVHLPPAGGDAVVEIANAGTAPLVISDITNDVPTFALSLSTATIQPGDSIDLSITYSGGPPGYAFLLVHSNDPDEGELPIELYGDTDELDIGDPAVQFTLETLSGDSETGGTGTFTLSEHAGKVVFFQIYNPNCPACPPAIADMQNTVLKEFEHHPRVVATTVTDSPIAATQDLWANNYLRGFTMIDAASFVVQSYDIPGGGVKSRGYVIGPDQTVVLPVSGYDPDRVIATIYEVLADNALPGDLDGDGLVAFPDLTMLLNAWGPNPGHVADLNGDGEVRLIDLTTLLANWSPWP